MANDKQIPIFDAAVRGERTLDSAVSAAPAPEELPPAPKKRGRPPKKNPSAEPKAAAAKPTDSAVALSAADATPATPAPQGRPVKAKAPQLPAENPRKPSPQPPTIPGVKPIKVTKIPADKTGKATAAEKAASPPAAPPAPPTAEPTQPKKRGRPKREGNAPGVKISFLGGMNEIGKNCYFYEYGDDAIVVDCGLSFPDQESPGVDVIIPDFTYAEQKLDKIRGVFITHGHEDHIGGLAYFLKHSNVPVYSAKLTLGLIRGKLKEHRILERSNLIEIVPGEEIKLGAFKVEGIHVNHSIPDAMAFAITTPAGTLIQTGDFKIDTTPIDGEIIDFASFCRFAQKGVLALLADSTNAERPGYTASERTVGDSFDSIFRKAEHRRIFVATFSSNIHRVQQIMDTAHQLGRKVALLGRSLENCVNVSMELGYLHVPDGLLIHIDMIHQYPPEKIVIISTGSQGEPMSALSRIAAGDHRKVQISPLDCVVISANPIPGNEKTVGKVINELLKRGAEVVYEKMYDVHVSGHACQEELKIMLGIVKPKFFIPVHGEQKQLVKHANLAQAVGIPPANIMIADNGVQLELTADDMKVNPNIPCGQRCIDNGSVGDVGSMVLKDRKRLSEDGILIVSVSVDRFSGQILSGPEVIQKGFSFVKESDDLLHDARDLAATIITNANKNGNRKDWVALRAKLRDDISQLAHQRTKRNPIVVIALLDR
ncbi:MAG: ribonuclease J [Oscillospiraceae bacterium]|jgi:ribonuclease J|nr:ribonuclease J [Oscillospiraceae bacterium]